MACRSSMRMDIEKCGLGNGVFIYSLWSGYRDSKYQQNFEKYLEDAGFMLEMLHTSGHAAIVDIRRVINGLNPHKIIPIHTMHPDAFLEFSDKTD